MKNLSKFMFLAAVTSATLFTSCTEDEPNNGTEENATTIPSNITSDVTLEGTEFILDGSVLVADGATLTIPAGATIKATKGFDSYILVLQGGKIIAEGTATAPITFMSGEASPASGDWGGLILNGYAPISGASEGTTGSTEINSAYPYGGTVSNDNSGSLKYIKLIHTGASTSDGVEHNGLTLNAVGNGTTIENIYVSEATDDAIEFFGGCVNVTNLLAVNSQDDMFDFTQGYTGTLTNAYGVWENGFSSDEEDPRGVEADGNLDGKTPSDVNQSNFTITNMTLLNLNSGFDGGDLNKIHDLVKVRRGATATINNALFSGLNTYGDFVDCEDSKGDANGATVINITNGSSEFTGSTKAGENNATINVTSNATGCDASIFSWTGYTIGSSSTTTTATTIPSNITTDTTLEGTEFILDGSVLVQSGATLTIPAGATIRANKGFDSYILVLQGGKIIAEGTESAPITFMSGEASPASGDWGGLILNGYAPISGASEGTTGSTEINSAYPYGGTDATDNSGSLKYVKLIHTGASTSDGVEHNGLTLNAVGNGTTIENIYVSEATDDAIEFFGGCVNVTNLLAVNSQDDMFDFTQGYCGTLTNAYGIWEDGFSSDEEDPRGVEADGNLDGKTPSDVNQSNFTITNMTLDNRNTAFDGSDLSKIHDLVKIRRGATATINNALFTGLNTYGDFVDCEDSKGDANGATVVNITNGSSEFTGSNKAGENNATINTPTDNSGCDATIFGWTGYTI